MKKRILCPNLRIYFRWLVLAVGLIAAGPKQLKADEYDQFISAKNAFDAGEYREAIARFTNLLKAGVNNTALVLECHKLLAVSYLFDGNRDAAEDHFTKLLTIDPNYSMDPMIYPMEVIDLFTAIKNKNEERLKALAEVRAQEAAQQKAIEEAKRKAELEKLTRNIYFEKTRRENSIFIALTPFGAGQFQNGETTKGVLFLGGELVLAATAITTYFLHENLRAKAPFDDSSARENAETRETTYRITNQATLIAAAALAVTGIVDALYNFKPVTQTWKRIDENEVPKDVKTTKSKSKLKIAPQLGTQMIGLAMSRDF